MASLATGEGTAGGGTAGEGTAGFVARCVASGSAGRICRRDLVTFFSCAAEAFGQASDGVAEAEALMKLLMPGTQADETNEGSILQSVFADYLARRFSRHEGHLTELSRVAAQMEKRRRRGGSGVRESGATETTPKNAANTIMTPVDTSGSPSEMSTGNTNPDTNATSAELRNTIDDLRSQLAAQDVKIKAVTAHHQRVLSAALSAARVERTKALNLGLADLTEKVKRLSTERLKRDAQIARLRAQISEARGDNPPSSPVVCRPRRSPGRLSSPGRIRPEVPLSAAEGMFLPLQKSERAYKTDGLHP